MSYMGKEPKRVDMYICINDSLCCTPETNTFKKYWVEDGGGIGRGGHFLSYRFIKRITKRRANFTKQLLITSWGHQVPRKATHCLQKDVGQNIKDKKRDKRAKDRDPSQEGSLNRGTFQTPGNPCTGGSGGSFWISEGNLTGRGRISKTHRLRA